MRLTLGVMQQEEGGRRHLSGRVSLFALIGAALLAVVLFSWVPLVQARDGANQLRATPLMEGKHMSIFIPSQSPTATSAATATSTPSPTSAATPTPTSASAATPGATATTATGSSGTNSSNNLLIWLLVGLLVLIILSLLANAARQRSYRQPPPDIP